MRVKQLIHKNRITLMVVVIGFLICSQLVNFFNSTQLEITYVARAYLAFAYGLFAVLLAINHLIPKQSYIYQRLKNIPLLNTAIASVIGICLLMTLEQISQHRVLYNAGAILAYAMLLYYLVGFVSKRMRTANELMAAKQRNFYLGYAIFLLVLFLMSPTMEQSDPYGPHFQLRVVFWLLLIHMIASWIMNLWKLNQQLRNEQQATELMHLKSQINPHFFFNTLNNLYGLALEKSDATPGLILRLSDMMRYTIYQGQQDSVPLQQEIDYLNNFIELQKIRFQKQVEVEFDIQIEQPVKVPPLLFINLVENAYKHGVETLADNAFVTMSMLVQNRQLTFTVRNNFDPDAASANSGIGLSNLAKRLELQYPNKHQLKIDKQSNCFTVTLELNLS